MEKESGDDKVAGLFLFAMDLVRKLLAAENHP